MAGVRLPVEIILRVGLAFISVYDITTANALFFGVMCLETTSAVTQLQLDLYLCLPKLCFRTG